MRRPNRGYVRDEWCDSTSCPRCQILASLLKCVADIVLVSSVFIAFGSKLSLLRGNQPSLVCPQLRGVTRDRCQACFENQPQQVVWVFTQYGVRLRLGEGQCADDLTNASHIVTLIGVERREHLISSQGHRREKLYAIDLSRTGEKHDSIVQTIGPLLR